MNGLRFSGLLLAITFFITLTATVGCADGADVPDAPLIGALDLTYAGHLEETDDSGMPLAWEGSIEGDISGTIRWWFVDPPPVPSTTFVGGQVFYYVARWEIRVDEKLILAGDSAGKTVTPDGSDGMWDGHGIVTEAYGEFARLKGHKVYETGPVIGGSNPPATITGTGMFQIY